MAIVAVGAAACAGPGRTPLPPVTFAPVAVISTPAPAPATPTQAPAPVTPTPQPSTPTPQPSAVGVVSIVLSEWKVDMPATVAAGQGNFTIANSGTTPHELLVFQSALELAAYPKQSNGDIDEEGAGISLISDGENIDPGGTQTRTVDLSAPGRYVFVCNIPGHFAQGMFIVVTVH